MKTYHGTLQTIDSAETPLRVAIQLDGERVRMWSDRHRMGSWDVEELRVERRSIFRFLVGVGEDSYEFSPDDPSGFASDMNVEIDLTAPEKPRFGLAARLKQIESS